MNGEKLDGSRALFRALERELLRDKSFITGATLSDLTKEDLRRILQGNDDIPLFEERLYALRDSGEIFRDKFDDSWMKVYEDAHNNAIKLTQLLIDKFPSFDDKGVYKGQKIYFYKRAQLNSKMVSDILVSEGRDKLKDLNRLTAFADYKVPQILRNVGILIYQEKLADKVDNFEILPRDSREEIEIWIATIWSVELLKQSLSKKLPNVTASHIDSLLWNRSGSLDRDKNPYHRTITTAY